jgi:hypothetical protein
MEVGVLREYLDLRVHDRVALDEIELYAEVLTAVAVCDRMLTAAEVDAALGLGSVARVIGAIERAAPAMSQSVKPVAALRD